METEEAFKKEFPSQHEDIRELNHIVGDTVFEFMEQHAVKFALWSDSEECLIKLDATPDIEGEHIEEKCYRIWGK